MAAVRFSTSGSVGIILIIVATVVSSVTGNQELIVHHTPSHVKFLKDAGSLSARDVDKVITASYGFDSDDVLSWPGLAHTSAFKRPKATVLISVPGFTDSRLETTDASLQRYDLSHAQEMINTAGVINSIQSGFLEHKPLIIDMSQQDRTLYPEVFQDVLNVDGAAPDEPSLVRDLGALNASKPLDWAFVSELEVLRRVVKAVELKKTAIEDKIPDFFHLYVHAYQRIVEHYGADSPQARDARRLLNSVISWMTKTFRRLYKDNVVVLVVTLASHPTPTDGGRHKRAAGAEGTAADVGTEAGKQHSSGDQKLLNTADSYSSDFPAIFNIILFTVLILLLSAFGISYCMWFMDPGRDSIIYRMTSQRIKKD